MNFTSWKGEKRDKKKGYFFVCLTWLSHYIHPPLKSVQRCSVTGANKLPSLVYISMGCVFCYLPPGTSCLLGAAFHVYAVHSSQAVCSHHLASQNTVTPENVQTIWGLGLENYIMFWERKDQLWSVHCPKSWRNGSWELSENITWHQLISAAPWALRARCPSWNRGSLANLLLDTDVFMVISISCQKHGVETNSECTVSVNTDIMLQHLFLKTFYQCVLLSGQLGSWWTGLPGLLLSSLFWGWWTQGVPGLSSAGRYGPYIPVPVNPLLGTWDLLGLP